MTVTAEESGRPAGRLSVRLEHALLGLVAAVFAARFHLIFASEVNWDEFLFLSRVHEFARGELSLVLQTAHVHAFTWLPLVSGNEVDQVVAARLVVFALSLASALLLYGAFRRLLSHRSALFAVFCYAAFSFVIQHGSSFRADGIATFLLVAAIYLLLVRQSLLAAAGAGLLIGLAGMVTVKSALYLPTIAALMLGQLLLGPRSLPTIGRAIALAVSTALAFAGVYAVHRLSLGDVAGYSSGDVLARSYRRTIEQPGIFPQWRIAVHAALANGVILAALLVGAGLALERLLRGNGEERIRTLMLLSLAAPLATILFYRNSFPYYYVFMLAPASALCGFAAERLPWRARPERATAIGAAVLIAIGAGAAANYVKAAGRGSEVQRATLDVVHRMFPEPVPYIDRCSMVASFPKAGIFMSSWGMLNYYEAGQPIMRQTLIDTAPRFLIANIEALDLDGLEEGKFGRDHYRLLREDVETLKANFVHHWGAIYVAGKAFDLAGADVPEEFEVLIPGRYTLESESAVSIDGAIVQSGEAVRLSRGMHRIAGRAGRAAIRHGPGLYRPARQPPEGPVFHGF